MLAIKLKKFDRECAPTSGGVSRLWIFDRDDFDFTQGVADADGNKPPYTAIALRAGATADGGGLLFKVLFEYKTAEYKYSQSLTGSSVKYEHSLEMLLPDIGHFITQWNERVDSASACNGIGMIIELNSGKIIVIGEKYVNGDPIREWRIVQNGSSATSGKLFEDPNGQTTVLTGDFYRSAYEYSGTVASLLALEADNAS